MSWRKTIFTIAGLAILLGLAGCKRDPRDIAKWKAEGKTGKLISATGDHRQFVRIDAIKALAELKAKEAIEPLVALFSDSDLVVVHKAVDAVASMDDPRLEKHMLKALEIKSPIARTTAITTLGNLKSEAAVDPLIAAFDDEFEEVAVAAATALGQIGNPKAVGPLTEKVDDRSFNMRMACVTSLGQIGGPEAAEALEPALGDMSKKIRVATIEGLIGIGPSTAPLALDALRNGDPLVRESGMAVLQGLNDVPTTGSDGVWYRLASLTAGENPVVDPAKNTEIPSIDDNMDALLEALTHEQPEVRDYALLTLASMGESSAAPVLALAEQNTGRKEKTWLTGRSVWYGAPDWKIDLWAAATTLNPGFRVNERIASDLKPHSQTAEQMMKSLEFKPSRPYIPLLIAQFAAFGSEYASGKRTHSLFGIEFTSEVTDFSTGQTQGSIDRQRTKRCRLLAEKHLINTDYQAVLPLLAALNDDDLDIVAHSAQTLLKICHERAEEPVIAAFSTRFENGVELSGSAFQRVMQDLSTPEVKAMLMKVRPNAVQAIRTAQKKYPNVEFSNIPLDDAVDPSLKAAPFRLAYFNGDRRTELRIIFRPDENGNWVPTPPLADKLPE